MSVNGAALRTCGAALTLEDFESGDACMTRCLDRARAAARTDLPILIVGESGCGKTLLAAEFLIRGATQFDEPGAFISFEETGEELAQNVRSLGFDLDALADSLGDLSWLRADGYLLLVEHSDAWRQADDDNFATLLDILNEAAAAWGDQGVPFWALMPLAQDELGKLVI